MNFLNPLALIGLVAAAVPFILHLLNLRRAKKVEFSTVRFLKELQKSKIRKIKLKQIILLILRMLIIACLVIAFARPATRGTVPFMNNYAKSSIVIALDNSISTDVSDENGNRFNQIRKATGEIINNLNEGDEAAIVEMTSPNPDKAALSRNNNLLRDELSKIKIQAVRADLNSSLKISDIVIKDAKNLLNKELFIITDAQKNIFKSLDTSKIKSSYNGIFVVPVGINSKADIANLSIDSINLITKVFQPGKPIETEIFVTNHSGSDVNGALISLNFNGERVAQRTLDIPGKSTRSALIAATTQAKGGIRGVAELEGDAMDFDNKRYFSFFIPDSPNILIVGSDESSFFIKTALTTAYGTEPKKIDPNAFNSFDISNTDIVIFSGGEYSDDEFSKLKRFVESGGNSIIFASDKTPSDIFARNIISLGFSNFVPQSFAKNSPLRITSYDKPHPVFDGMLRDNASDRGTLESPDIYKIYSVNGSGNLISAGSLNFMSELKKGNGKIIYFGVTAAGSFSTFPVTGLFPTLLYGSTYYLANGENLNMIAESGSDINIYVPGRFTGDGNFKIQDPNGNEFFAHSADLGNMHVLRLSNLSVPGIYSVENSNKKLVALPAVNMDKSESDVAAPKKSDLEQLIAGRFLNKTNIVVIDDISKINSGIIKARTGTELWQIFILAALIFAIAEMFVQKVSKIEAEA